MFFTNKWANLAVFAAVALVVTLVIVNATKVVGKDGTVADTSLKPFAKAPAAK